MLELNDRSVLYAPELLRLNRDGLFILLDGEAPNWIVTDERGDIIFRLIDGKRSFSDIVQEYSRVYKMDTAKAWLHVHDLLQEGIRHNIISPRPIIPVPYLGRSRYLALSRLREFWIHLNNSCNLSCRHCLVSSCPDGDPGLILDQIKKIIDETACLGVYRYYLTGGEPFLRKDIFELIGYITREKGAELIILTNATLLKGERLDRMKEQDRSRLKLQVSLDGPSPEVNDPIRGKGTFRQVMEALDIISDLGFDISLTAVIMKQNLNELGSLPGIAKEKGIRSIHIMWPHRRGRMLEGNGSGDDSFFPTAEELLAKAREIKRGADSSGILFDNYESLKLRVNGRPRIKYDLGNACWDGLCIYPNGDIYPSASFAGLPELSLGSALEQDIRTLWLESPVARRFRSASLIGKAGVSHDPYRFITGGGDIEQSYFFSKTMTGTGDILAEDPYYELYREMAKDIIFDLAASRRSAINTRTGYTTPVIYHAMGDGATLCGTEELLLAGQDVSTIHSNCVLSFDVEKPHRVVQEFYGKAAETPKPELCCPVSYNTGDVGHIPKEVLERFYGCGSPVSLANLRPGEVMVDLGSGGGVDCFIAAKRVGPGGRVIGVDMTGPMLEVANRNKILVAQNLGYDVVEFRKGYLEEIPTEDSSVDLVTSNCVINLSPDKRKVFSEIWRILKDHGRIVISDIVSDHPTPPHIKANEHLWGECIAGALTEDEFISWLEQAGFYGLEVLKKGFWKGVEGFRFYSVTVRGFKYEKKKGCLYLGQKAIYLGPFKAVMDEEGHIFPRGVAVEVCTDTAAKLTQSPYSALFTVTGPDSRGDRIDKGAGSGKEVSCGTGCC